MAVKKINYRPQKSIENCSKLLLAKLVISAFAFCLPLQVVGQDDLEIGNWVIDNEVMASQVAPIRKNPPEGFFLWRGKQVSNTIPNASYIISDFRTVPNSFTHQTWVLVEPAVTSGEDISGWVYWGEDITSDSKNFKAISELPTVE